ncbi:hypothetical protein GYH30_012030 [Glycine max]|nr:hypothetical protein GYH30_012030 [Glycine max]
MHLLDPSRTPLSAHFRISLPKRHHFASCSLVALLEPPPFFFISHMYRFLRIVRFAFLAGSFGHLLDPMDVENLPS